MLHFDVVSHKIGVRPLPFVKRYISLADNPTKESHWIDIRQNEDYVLAMLSSIAVDAQIEVEAMSAVNLEKPVGTFISSEEQFRLILGTHFYINSVTKKMINDLSETNAKFYKGPSGIGKSCGMYLASQYVKYRRNFQIFISEPGPIIQRCYNLNVSEYYENAEKRQILQAIIGSNEEETLARVLSNDLVVKLNSFKDTNLADPNAKKEDPAQVYSQIIEQVEKKQKDDGEVVYVFVDNMHDLVSTIYRLDGSLKLISQHPLILLTKSSSEQPFNAGDLRLRVTASQHYAYDLLDQNDQSRIAKLNVPLEPMDLFGLKMCMKLGDQTRYGNEEWPNRCITDGGCIARMAFKIFKNLQLGRSDVTVTSQIRNLASEYFQQKVAMHFKDMLNIHQKDFQQFLERMAVKLEENLVEVDAGSRFHVDEAVYVDSAFVSEAARIAYCIEVSKNIKMSSFSPRSEKELEYVVKAKINSKGIDFSHARFPGRDDRSFEYATVEPPAYSVVLRYKEIQVWKNNVRTSTASFDATSKPEAAAYRWFIDHPHQGKTLYLNIKPEEGKKTPLKAFDHILVEKGRYGSARFWLIQISGEQKVTQNRLVNLHTDGVDVLNALLKLWKPDKTPKAIIRERNTGYEVNRSTFAVLEPWEEEDDEKEPEIEAWVIYMNPFRQGYFDRLHSYNDLLVIDGKWMSHYYNFTTDELDIFWEK